MVYGEQEKRCNRMSLIILCIGKRVGESTQFFNLFFPMQSKLGTIKNHINGHIGLIKY